MASRLSKTYLSFFRISLFLAVFWTYFQPAFRIELSGITGREWSAQQLAAGFYQNTLKTLSPRKGPSVNVKMDFGFVDFLKKIFPKKKHESNAKAYAGLVLGVLIPITFLCAYLSLILGMVGSWLPAFSKTKFFFSAAFLLSSYALIAVLVLHEKAGAMVNASLEQASRGVFGFIGKSFVQRMSIEPGTALVSFPVLAALIWFLAALKRR